MSGDLAGWLLTQISEDERWARLAGSSEWASWNRSWDEGCRDIAADGQRVFTVPMDIDEHVARHSPARVLAECAAKRAIIAACYGDDPTQGDFDPRYADERLPALVLLALAQPYSDRPGFRPEWQVTP